MPQRVFVFPTMLILGMALPVAPASADPVQIMGGSVILEGRFSNSVDIHGTQGFRAELVFGTLAGRFLCGPCGVPGDPFDLSSYLDTVDGRGMVEFGGATYEVGSIGSVSPGTGVLALRPVTGRFVLPPLATRATLSVPFELADSALFLFIEHPGITTVPVAGRGTATLELIASQFTPSVWELGRLRYDFEPVPEPATLVLLGTGMLALVARRRRHRSPGL